MNEAGWPVRFDVAPPEWDAAALETLRRADPVSWQRQVALFPALATADEGAALRAVVAGYHARAAQLRREAAAELAAAWEQRHAAWMAVLDGMLGEQARRPEPVTTLASLSLLSPRHLGTRRFSVPFFVAMRRQLAICAHETLHFRYFEWLARHEPGLDAAEYEAPHRAWAVSEVIASALLCDPAAEALFGPGPSDCYAATAAQLGATAAAWSQCRAQKLPFAAFVGRVDSIMAAA